MTKTTIGIICISILYFGSVNAIAQKKVPAASSFYQAGLGVGWDSKKELFRGECVQGTEVSRGIGQATLDFKQTISYSQLEKELGFGAGGRARIGVLEVNAAAKFLKSSKSDAFSISAIYQGDYQFKNSILEGRSPTETMKLIVDKDDKWEDACGDEYIQQVTLGAKIFFSIRIDFASEMEKKSFEANFGVSGPLFSASASLQTAMNDFSKRTKVTVSALQIGGNVDRISKIFGTPSNMVKCSFGQFDTCSAVLSSALDYATNQFPEQISLEAQGKKENTGPVVLSYLTAPYATAGIFPKHSVTLREEVKRARRKIDELIKSSYEQWMFADRYLQDSSRRLSGRQASIIGSAKRSLDANIEKIVSAAEACYNDIDECMPRVNALEPGQESGLVTVDKSIFVIENESFAQFCDDGVSPLPNTSPGLKETIHGLLDTAKALSPESFLPRFEGQEIDSCFVAAGIFLKSRNLKLARSSISDLRPLMEFGQLEELDLSNNKITSLSPFELDFVTRDGGFKNLKKLILSNNHIVDVSPLNRISGLETLSLSYNCIRNANVLSGLKNLKWVDLRNNNQDLICELDSSVTSLTADHGSSGSFAEISRRTTYVNRFAMSALNLDSGDVLITGGIFGGADTMGAEKFKSESATFELLPGMNKDRLWHTATRLQDGKVLITGGLGLNSAELFDPETGVFTLVQSSMLSARAGHTATLLNDGRVLIAGGWQVTSFAAPTPTVEIYDPKTKTFSVLKSGLSLPRATHTASLLSSGEVLFVGGVTDSGSTNTIDIFDPKSMTVRSLGRRMQFARGMHTVTTLQDGKILVAGGIDGNVVLDSAEIFDPNGKQFHLISSHLVEKRSGHQAKLLSNGLVVFTGGTQTTEEIMNEPVCKGCIASSEIFDPVNQDFSLLKSQMIHPRVFHTMTELAPDQFLIVGGLGKDAGTTAEYFLYTSPNNRK